MCLSKIAKKIGNFVHSKDFSTLGNAFCKIVFIILRFLATQSILDDTKLKTKMSTNIKQSLERYRTKQAASLKKR